MCSYCVFRNLCCQNVAGTLPSSKAKVIAIVHRHNDVEDKLVAAPEGISFTKMEIEDAVRFQEQYFESEIEIL